MSKKKIDPEVEEMERYDANISDPELRFSQPGFSQPGFSQPDLSESRCSRRSLLKGAAVAGAAVSAGTLTSFVNATKSRASDSEHRIIFCRFGGGWDTLTGLDPRGENRPGIDTGWDQYTGDNLSKRGVLTITPPGGRGEYIVGTSMRPLVTTHQDKVTIFRGINMNTVAHATGVAYMHTGKAPSGATPRGSSLTTVVSANSPIRRDLPNVGIQVPLYNEDFDETANGIGFNRSYDLPTLLGEFTGKFGGGVEELLRQAQAEARSCVSNRYVGIAPSVDLDIARARLRDLQLQNVAERFRLNERADLRDLYSLSADNANQDDARARAAVAAQLIKQGLSHSVSILIRNGLDTHSTNWATNQWNLQNQGWDAISRMVTDLRENGSSDVPADPNLERTTIICTSDFARTPKINGSSGRDHWFAGGVVVIGGNLNPGVFGLTDQDNFGLKKVDFSTGLAAEAGTVIKPEHVYATIAKSMGMAAADIERFRVPTFDDWIEA